MKLSILIVNWNTRDLVVACVNSILKNEPVFSYEVIIVDNRSDDGSADAFKMQFGSDNRIKVIAAEKNLGFAAGNNLAYRNSTGEFILLLNPDTEVREGALRKMVEFVERNPQIGILGPKIINPDGSVQPSVRGLPDVWSSLVVFSGLHRFLRPRHYLMDDFDYNQMSEVPQVMGAALLTRREVIEKAGGLFDEQFFLWYEEVDFCRRSAAVGFKVVYFPEAQVVHRQAQSFSQMSVFARKKAAADSLRYYFQKNGSAGEVILINLVLPVVLFFAKMFDLLEVKSKIHV